MEVCQRCVLSWTAFTVLMAMACAQGATPTDEVAGNASDPLVSLTVRQEAALRKLDGLAAMVSKVDDLETKIDLLTNLLNDHKEKYSEMEAKLASIETKQEVLVEAVGVKLDHKLEEMNDKLEEKMGQVEDKIGAKFEEVEDLVRATLGPMYGTMEDISSNMTTLNQSVHMIGASVCQVEDRLDYVFFEHPDECQAVADLLANMSRASQQMVEAHMLNLTLATEVALADMKDYVVSVAEGAANRSRHECDAEDVVGYRESLSRLEALVAPSANATKHLIAAVFNRIRLSNLAMDKRLGALLHTSSIRQRVLQDTLLASITSVDTLIKTQSHDVYRRVVSRLSEMEDSLAASTKRHAKELATQVLEAANHTLGDVSSTTATQLDLLLQAYANTTAALDVGLDQLQELHNLTMSNLGDSHLCVTTVPGVARDVSTSTYTAQPSGALDDDQVSNMRDHLANQLTHISEQLAGLRIYYSTSLHMHREQMAEEVAAVQAGVRRAVQDTLTKMTRTLEKLRRSSLSYLDAAVTTVSSAAVASAQATANQLATALKDVADALQDRLAKVESGVRLLTSGCPAEYTWVGGTCLLALPDAHASWQEARIRCRKTGGDLALIPSNTTMGHIRSFLYITHAWESAPPPPYWLGGRLVEGEWTWVTGAPGMLQVVADSWVVEEEEEDEEGGEAGECLMSVGNGVRLVPGRCQTPRAALCQHRDALTRVSHTPYEPNNSQSNALDPSTTDLNTNEHLFFTAENFN